MRVALVHNPASHANLRRGGRTPPSDMLFAEAGAPDDLARDLARFAAEGVELLAIDGGDGTIREVLSALPAAFGDRSPLLALLPTGKTNVLAIDLGVPRGWSLDELLAAARSPQPTIKVRAPLEIRRDDGRPPLRGFVFGLGAYVRATTLSHRVHRLGVYQGVSVAMTIVGAVFGALMGGRRDRWRAGTPVTLTVDDGLERTGDRLLVLATTLKRLPFGLKPFGTPREGLKVLDIDAPPQRLLRATKALLSGRDAPWLAALGYRRGDATTLRLHSDAPFVLDGEAYDGGGLTLALGPPLRFVVG
ncbi:MAG: diacylglycerol kinase catalytic region [Caulobacter sp.]|nr:diacylglycerol kinase catalytic region [Caulobacter sp.]